MKKGLIVALLCILGIAAKAQNIVNNTRCDITITPVCYNPTTCAYTTCGTTVVVTAGSTVAIPACLCPVSSNYQGYSICWLSTSSLCGPCVTLGACGMSSYPCPDFQPTARLSSCDNCTAHVGANISCTSSGNIVVQ